MKTPFAFFDKHVSIVFVAVLVIGLSQLVWPEFREVGAKAEQKTGDGVKDGETPAAKPPASTPPANNAATPLPIPPVVLEPPVAPSVPLVTTAGNNKKKLFERNNNIINDYSGLSPRLSKHSAGNIVNSILYICLFSESGKTEFAAMLEKIPDDDTGTEADLEKLKEAERRIEKGEKIIIEAKKILSPSPPPSQPSPSSNSRSASAGLNGKGENRPENTSTTRGGAKAVNNTPRKPDAQNGGNKPTENNSKKQQGMIIPEPASRPSASQTSSVQPATPSPASAAPAHPVSPATTNKHSQQ